jgi:hypothetical protein
MIFKLRFGLRLRCRGKLFNKRELTDYFFEGQHLYFAFAKWVSSNFEENLGVVNEFKFRSKSKVQYLLTKPIGKIENSSK